MSVPSSKHKNPGQLARQAARLEKAINDAVIQVIAALPEVGADQARAALEAAVPIPVRGAARFLEELTEHMAARPDALVSGAAGCPRVLLRLVHALHDAGFPVVRPACTRCGKITADLKPGPEGRVCRSCYVALRTGACERCGAENVRITARRPDGRICVSCYRKDPDRLEDCVGCGRRACPVTRREDGGALCHRCYDRPKYVGVSCGETAVAVLINSEGPHCKRCYKTHRPRRTCGRCGRERVIARAATAETPDLCDSCYRGPQATCSRCGRSRPCMRVSSGTPICDLCYQREEQARADCSRCGRHLPVTARWPIGPVCTTCYTSILRNPAPCTTCGTSQPLIARDADGQGLCGPCVGLDVDYTCRQCGRTGRPYGQGRCAYCVLADRVRDLLTGPDGLIAEQLQPLADALNETESPFNQITWITSSTSARLLAQLIGRGERLTHELLDGLPLDRNVHYVRQLLVHSGALPERHEDLERLPAWLEHKLADKPVAHANLIRPFAHWHLLRRARIRAAARKFPATTSRVLQRRVTVALDFLAWLDDRQIPLDQLQQDNVDRWLEAGNRNTSYEIRYFLKWAGGRRLTGRLTVPTVPSREPTELLDDQERWDLVQECLTQDTKPIDVRAAGALILLFGLPSERVRHLTADQIIQEDEHTYLAAGRHPILLPPRLARLLLRLASEPGGQPPTIAHELRGPSYLFPGRIPGQPIGASSLSTRLKRHGITARTARNGALIALAADLPAAILADLLGMHIHTAIRWATYGQRNWTKYLAARAADQEQSSGQAASRKSARVEE